MPADVPVVLTPEELAALHLPTNGDWAADRFYWKHLGRMEDAWWYSVDDEHGPMLYIPTDDEDQAAALAGIITILPRLLASALHYAQKAAAPSRLVDKGMRDMAMQIIESERDAHAARAERAEASEQSALVKWLAAESLLDRARAVLADYERALVDREHGGVAADRALGRLADLLTPTTEEGEADG